MVQKVLMIGKLRFSNLFCVFVKFQISKLAQNSIRQQILVTIALLGSNLLQTR